MHIDRDVPIAMDDGVLLRADIFRPDGDGAWPVLMSHGPYAKGLAFQEGFSRPWQIMTTQFPEVAQGSSNAHQNWEVVDPEKWVPQGYVCIRVDSRGAGRSPGFIDVWSPRETRDFHDCIEWAGVQPWSNGKVGLVGISYYAINQWQVAALKPSHLAAICVWEGAADFYRDVYRHGGIANVMPLEWFPRQVASVQHGVGSRGRKSRVTGEWIAGPETMEEAELAGLRCDLAADVLSRPLDGEWYAARTPDWNEITVPLLSAANWGGHGLHTRGNFEGFMHAASPHKWLEAHGLAHWTHFYTDYGRSLQLRFFDHFLKGKDSGWERQPRVQLQVRHPGERFVERHENEWPLARTRWTRLYLHGDGALRADAPAQDAQLGYATMGTGLSFHWGPHAEALEITGPIAARLFISSSTIDADLFVILRVYDPTGLEVTFEGALDPRTPVAQGWLRASQRRLDLARSLPWRPFHSHDRREPLSPGVPVALDIEIWPTSIVVPAGYRIVLQVRGRDYHCDGAPLVVPGAHYPFTGVGPFRHDHPLDRPSSVFDTTCTLHCGPAHESFVLLPIIPRRE